MLNESDVGLSLIMLEFDVTRNYSLQLYLCIPCSCLNYEKSVQQLYERYFLQLTNFEADCTSVFDVPITFMALPEHPLMLYVFVIMFRLHTCTLRLPLE